MSILNTISTVSNSISLGSSALSLVGMGTSLFRKKNPLEKGIGGFLFDIKITESISNTAQITDHFSEENTYLHDHIAINPMTITLTGKIGELVYTKQEGLEFLKAMVNRLTPLGVLSPSQSVMATQYLAKAEVARSAFNSLEKSLNNLADVFAGRETETKQAIAYGKLEGFFLNRAAITIETPWKTFPNMVIESFTTDQGEDSLMETTFTVTCKQIRFIGIETLSKDLITSRYDAATSSVKNTGIQTGENADSTSVISKTGGQ